MLPPFDEPAQSPGPVEELHNRLPRCGIPHGSRRRRRANEREGRLIQADNRSRRAGTRQVTLPSPESSHAPHDQTRNRKAQGAGKKRYGAAPPASRVLRTALRAALDPGDHGGLWEQEKRQATGQPRRADHQNRSLHG
jgi:hypothetical protein